MASFSHPENGGVALGVRESENRSRQAPVTALNMTPRGVCSGVPAGRDKDQAVFLGSRTMLRLVTGQKNQRCNGTTRREFLQVGTLALGGLSLPQLLAARAEAAKAGRAVKDTSIVLLFLTGGPSQIETFDPKMSAPSDYRSVTGEVATEIPGLTFGGTFPQLARLAKRMTIVRSFTHGNADHTGAVNDVMRCGNPADAGMGAIVTRLRGPSHPRTGMPSHVFLTINEPDPQFDRERLRLAQRPARVVSAERMGLRRSVGSQP